MNAVSSPQNSLRLAGEALHIDDPACGSLDISYLWLRHNCDCAECVVAQTSERRFLLSDVTADLQPQNAELRDGVLSVVWPDGHRTRFEVASIRGPNPDRYPAWHPWSAGFLPRQFDWTGFLQGGTEAIGALQALLRDGAIVLTAAPVEALSLEALACRLGPVREMPFARIHNVQLDFSGYNVAHTSLRLPPHNDFASATWQPSIQALHMLANETPGGESVIVDGWSLLRDLREEHPDYFDILCRFPVPFRMFDAATDTYCVQPIVRLNANGRIAGLRFSNQLMLSIDPCAPGATQFYRAYHELSSRVLSDRYRVSFRLQGGQVLIVAAHRVLHAREAFEPVGRRHLQDAYFELDNAVNHLFVLQRSQGSTHV